MSQIKVNTLTYYQSEMSATFFARHFDMLLPRLDNETSMFPITSHYVKKLGIEILG